MRRDDLMAQLEDYAIPQVERALAEGRAQTFINQMLYGLVALALAGYDVRKPPVGQLWKEELAKFISAHELEILTTAGELAERVIARLDAKLENAVLETPTDGQVN